MKNDIVYENVVSALYDYYGLIVDENVVREVIKNNKNIAEEAMDDGIRDTCQREILIDTVLKHLNLPPWPTYGDGVADYNKFIAMLQTNDKIRLDS